jgi:adenine-specific DNA-methyltransferase
MKATASFSHRRFRNIDERGAYKEDDPTAPGGRRFELRDSRNGRVIPLRRNRGWGFDQNEFDRLVAENRISFVTENSIMVRRYLHETAALTPPSVFYQPARSASERLARLMGENVFDFPKDESVLAKFVEMATAPTDGDIVLDFFAGSGTTGHAVWNLNQQDGGNRRFILVQLPEKLEHTEYRTLAAITSERLRRAGYAIGRASPPFAGDLGFRVFRLASSNVRAWQTRATDLDQALLDLVDNIAVDRSDDDILYELILKRGLDLSAPVERRTIAGKNIYSVSSGALFVCLTQSIGIVDAELIANEIAAWRATLPAAETMCIFRDSAFADDVAKATLIASFGQRGLSNVRSL